MSTITIRPITLTDTDNVVKWRNVSFVKKNLYTQTTLTNEQHIDYYYKNIETEKVFQFIIHLESDNLRQDIGTTFLKNVDWNNKKAEFGIFIGESDALGKGYGKGATKLTIDYAFSVLHLNRVYLSVFADNSSAVNAYEKCGFVIEGRLSQDVLRSDGYTDVMIMGITKNMWVGNRIDG